MASETIRIGIVGGTGYTGVELLRLLAQQATPPGQAAEQVERQMGGVGPRDCTHTVHRTLIPTTRFSLG